MNNLKLFKSSAVLSKVFAYISVVVFLFCLTQEGYGTAMSYGKNPAWSLFLIGWFAVLGGMVAWLANPCLIFAWYCFFTRKFIGSLFLSVAAIGFILSFQTVKEILINEAGTTSKIVSYGLGYWLWLASGVSILFASLAALIQKKMV